VLFFYTECGQGHGAAPEADTGLNGKACFLVKEASDRKGTAERPTWSDFGSGRLPPEKKIFSKYFLIILILFFFVKYEFIW